MPDDQPPHSAAAVHSKLTPAAKRHMDAAQGWLGLGLPADASDELAKISSPMRMHPDVLMVSYEIHAALKQWQLAAETANLICTVLPQEAIGFIHTAYALHELGQTKEARDVLLPIADKFPDESTIPYNLACYYCRLGDKKTAWDWLGRAIDISDCKAIKLRALDDPDLHDLRAEISDL